LGAVESAFPAGLRIEKDNRCIGADIVADIPGKEGAVGKQNMTRMKVFVGRNRWDLAAGNGGCGLQAKKTYNKE
jgi:hypothetical protein